MGARRKGGAPGIGRSTTDRRSPCHHSCRCATLCKAQRQARRCRCRSLQKLCCPTAMRPLAYTCQLHVDSSAHVTARRASRISQVERAASCAQRSCIAVVRCQGSACCGRHEKHATGACKQAAHKTEAVAASVYCKPVRVHAASAACISERPPAMGVGRRLRLENAVLASDGDPSSAAASALLAVKSCRRWPGWVQAG